MWKLVCLSFLPLPPPTTTTYKTRWMYINYSSLLRKTNSISICYRTAGCCVLYRVNIKSAACLLSELEINPPTTIFMLIKDFHSWTGIHCNRRFTQFSGTFARIPVVVHFRPSNRQINTNFICALAHNPCPVQMVDQWS